MYGLIKNNNGQMVKVKTLTIEEVIILELKTNKYIKHHSEGYYIEIKTDNDVEILTKALIFNDLNEHEINRLNWLIDNQLHTNAKIVVEAGAYVSGTDALDLALQGYVVADKEGFLVSYIELNNKDIRISNHIAVGFFNSQLIKNMKLPENKEELIIDYKIDPYSNYKFVGATRKDLERMVKEYTKDFSYFEVNKTSKYI